MRLFYSPLVDFRLFYNFLVLDIASCKKRENALCENDPWNIPSWKGPTRISKVHFLTRIGNEFTHVLIGSCSQH